MAKRINIEPGTKFNEFTVVRFSHTEKQDGRSLAMWFCNCSCGTLDFPVSGVDLRRGNVKSCGCLKRKNLEKMRLRKQAKKESNDE